MIHGNNTITIGVCPEGSDQLVRAENLAAELGLTLTTCDSGKFPLLLLCTSDGLALKLAGKNAPGPVMADFTGSTMAYRLKHGGGRRQALARAIGLKKGTSPFVIDATAGLGRDGFILAHLGCRVHMIERSPILAAMIEDGLQRAGLEPWAAATVGRIRCSLADSREYLQKLREDERPEVIYLDPMYPVRTKTSLVKKEMRILRQFAGGDEDADDLFNTSLECARNRVVVKRPRLAPELGNRKPSHAFSGKSSRFDVYLV